MGMFTKSELEMAKSVDLKAVACDVAGNDKRYAFHVENDSDSASVRHGIPP